MRDAGQGLLTFSVSVQALLGDSSTFAETPPLTVQLEVTSRSSLSQNTVTKRVTWILMLAARFAFFPKNPSPLSNSYSYTAPSVKKRRRYRTRYGAETPVTPFEIEQLCLR